MFARPRAQSPGGRRQLARDGAFVFGESPPYYRWSSTLNFPPNRALNSTIEPAAVVEPRGDCRHILLRVIENVLHLSFDNVVATTL